MASASAQPASLGAQATLLPGDEIRTGPNGRVLLVRGEETILVAPNSVVALPDQAVSSLATTILQQAGSITVKAQKRDVNHFEVRTPYLAAVVKGTEFTVVIERHSADVQVASGRVEVTDFKTGQVALVLPGQAARSSVPGENGLKLRGSGSFDPVRQGEPGKATLQPVDVPKTGLGSPPNKPDQHVRALTASAKQALALPPGIVRIGSPIGSVKLDVHKATGGLARSETGLALSSTVKATVWNSPSGPGAIVSASTNAGGGGGGGGNSNSGANANANANANVGGNGGIGVGLNAGNGGIGVGVNAGNGGIGVGLNLGGGPGVNVGVGTGGIGLNVGNLGIGKK